MITTCLVPLMVNKNLKDYFFHDFEISTSVFGRIDEKNWIVRSRGATIVCKTKFDFICIKEKYVKRKSSNPHDAVVVF